MTSEPLSSESKKHSVPSSMPRKGTSGYVGVSWNKREGKWICRLRKNNKSLFDQLFDCPHKAALARAEHELLEIYLVIAQAKMALEEQ